jgi:hypothetical protein
MKGVLMGAFVDKKIVQILCCFVIDIYDHVPIAQLGGHLVIIIIFNYFRFFLDF